MTGDIYLGCENMMEVEIDQQEASEIRTVQEAADYLTKLSEK